MAIKCEDLRLVHRFMLIIVAFLKEGDLEALLSYSPNLMSWMFCSYITVSFQYASPLQCITYHWLYRHHIKKKYKTSVSSFITVVFF